MGHTAGDQRHRNAEDVCADWTFELTSLILCTVFQIRRFSSPDLELRLFQLCTGITLGRLHTCSLLETMTASAQIVLNSGCTETA